MEQQEWKRFLDRCLLNRISLDKFERLAEVLYARFSLSSPEIAKIFLTPRSRSLVSFDPLIPAYVERLFSLDRVDIPSVLRVLLRTSHLYSPTLGENKGDEEDSGRTVEGTWYNSPELIEILLYRVLRIFTTGARPRTTQEVWGTIRVVSDWMSSVVAASTKSEMMQDINSGNAGPQSEDIATREALGNLVIALSENPKITRILTQSLPKASRLESFQKQHAIFDSAQSKALDDSMMGDIGVNGMEMHGVDTILDGPYTISKAGLYIYLNALLVGKPMTTDELVLNYLHTRYKGDISTLTTDLITASFDTLSNAMYRNEPNQTMFLLRSFLVNRIPVFLSSLSSSMFEPLTPEFCITQALSHVDPTAFPSFSQTFDMSSSSGILSDVRQEFLFACALHQLIAEENIERLLGEMPMQSLPEGGRYTKEELISQCSADPERVERLLGEIEGMEGNAGAIVGAIADVIRNLCTSKETMSLKTICTLLSRKPLSLDVILLFKTPLDILSPICQTLNTWRFEDDQGEYQPVYDEFGGILLLLLVFVHRYDLTIYDLGLMNDDSFVTELLRRGNVSKRMDVLTSQEDKNLGGWIRGLFEAEGISDELMSSCQPQDFYLLVPTLFSQTLAACNGNILDLETMKGGLEYLLETFLLPSLIGAISWLTTYLWSAPPESVPNLLQILQTLIKPTSISGDAQAMHGTIISIIAIPLASSLQSLRRLDPTRDDLEPILQTLQQPNSSSAFSAKRTTSVSHTELESWTSTHGGGLLASLRNTFGSLVSWSTTPDIHMTPPSYTHRQLLVAVSMLGARSVISTLIEEMKLQTDHGSADLAYDIATTLICAPTAADVQATQYTRFDLTHGGSSGVSGASPKRRLSLRGALRLEAEDAGKLAATDTIKAEIITRLNHRVEAHYGAAQVSQIMGDIDAAAVEDAAAGGGAMGMVGGSGGLDGLGGDGGLGLVGGGSGNIDDVLGAAGDELEGLGLMGVGDGGMDLS
ncbi:MAG: mediator complex subunit [Pycnora praestabilis]|nr:MAG: mediator complex subunit [Pycnora praestabilis]